MKPYEHTVQYYETDAMGAVHHSNYLRWFEEARIDYMAQLGVSYAELEHRGLVSPVLSAACEYRSMARFGETAEITVQLAEMTHVRYRITYTVTDRDSKTLRATGQTEHCFLDSNGRAVSLKRLDARLYELFSAQLLQEKTNL